MIDARDMLNSARSWLFGEEAAPAPAEASTPAPVDADANPVPTGAESDAGSDAAEAEESSSHITTGATWLWSWVTLMMVPWVKKETPTRASPTPPAADEWDPSRGVGDWQSRLAAYNEWADKQQAGGSDGSSSDDDDEDVDESIRQSVEAFEARRDEEAAAAINAALASGRQGVATDSRSLADRPDSMLTEAELHERHPWLRDDD